MHIRVITEESNTIDILTNLEEQIELMKDALFNKGYYKDNNKESDAMKRVLQLNMKLMKQSIDILKKRQEDFKRNDELKGNNLDELFVACSNLKAAQNELEKVKHSLVYVVNNIEDDE